jgi:magnesium-transporting ATPase (P-type)
MSNKLKRMIAAISGSVITYFIINLYIVPVGIFQYLWIELLFTIFYSLYGKVKEQTS